MPGKSKYLTTKEAMKYLRIKRLSTLYSYIHSGKLRAYRLGNNNSSRRHWRITQEDLDKFIEQGVANEARLEANSS